MFQSGPFGGKGVAPAGPEGGNSRRALRGVRGARRCRWHRHAALLAAGAPAKAYSSVLQSGKTGPLWAGPGGLHWPCRSLGASLGPALQEIVAWDAVGAMVARNVFFHAIGTFHLKDFMDFLASPEFWLALGQIIIIDILLGGDNAVVIALACRKLPPAQRTKGILWGTAGAIVLRVILIAFAMTLLALPFLKLVGALLLLWIGVKLLAPDEDGHGNVQGSDKLLAAIKTIIVADLVMSVDNVIAIAGAAQNAGDHSLLLVVRGLLISIPIIVWGSQLVIKLMERFPMIITLGGMLLGWIAGGMLVTDPVLANPDQWQWMPKLPLDDSSREVSAWVRYGASVAGALLVLLAGRIILARRAGSAAAGGVGGLGFDGRSGPLPPHRAAAAGHGAGRDRAPMPLRNRTAQRQPGAQAGKFALAVQALEQAEQQAGLRGIEADPVVLHGKCHMADRSGQGLHADARLRALACELDGIAQQLRQQLLQQRRVGMQRGQIRVHLPVDGAAAGLGGHRSRARPGHGLGQRDGLHAQRGATGVQQRPQSVDHQPHAPGGLVHRADEAQRLLHRGGL